jgi:hypothetical protein
MTNCSDNNDNNSSSSSSLLIFSTEPIDLNQYRTAPPEICMCCEISNVSHDPNDQYCNLCRICHDFIVNNQRWPEMNELRQHDQQSNTQNR